MHERGEMREMTQAISWIACWGVFALVVAGCKTTVDRSLPDPVKLAASGSSSSDNAGSNARASASVPAGAFVPVKVSGEGKAMGTHLAFSAFTTPRFSETEVRASFDAAIAEIQRVETRMTTWRGDSSVSAINRAAGVHPVTVDPETFLVIREALRVHRISEGTFDITFETMHGLWKFDEDLDPHPPTDAEIQKVLPFVGSSHVKMDEREQSVFIDSARTKISLGGIAKGYAVDRAVQVLEERGLKSFYVQAGGDLFARGKKPDGSEWTAGIRDPRGPDHFAVLPLSDHAFSTAGDYERSYVVGGRRYHHILDPRTGKPATACRSVTIWAPSALVADGIDDAVFILGPEKGLRLVEATEGVGAVIVDAKNNLWVSKRLEGKLRVLAPPSEGI